MTQFVHNLHELPYRNGVGIMLINRQHRVFVGQRIDTISDAWQMPQGGIDPNETPLDAAWRELKEEVGTDKAVLLGQTTGWLHYDLPKTIIPKIWGGKYRGQRQQWFLMGFTGIDTDIKLDLHEPEFHEWKWIPISALPSVIVPFKRQLYTDVIHALTPFIANAAW